MIGPLLTVWLLIFGVLVSLATVLIKIIIEFPGLLRLKCIYSEDRVDSSEDTMSRDLDKVSDKSRVLHYFASC